MQTAQNDAARLSSMVLQIHYFFKKLKNQDFEFQKHENLQNRFLVTKRVGNGPFQLKMSANDSE